MKSLKEEAEHLKSLNSSFDYAEHLLSQENLPEYERKSIEVLRDDTLEDIKEAEARIANLKSK